MTTNTNNLHIGVAHAIASINSALLNAPNGLTVDTLYIPWSGSGVPRAEFDQMVQKGVEQQTLTLTPSSKGQIVSLTEDYRNTLTTHPFFTAMVTAAGMHEPLTSALTITKQQAQHRS